MNYYKTKKWLLTRIYHNQKRNSKQRWHNAPKYTKEELWKWFFSQDNFEILFNNWKESWYEVDLIPSIDRKDDYKWYSFDNIQLMTFWENRKKWDMDQRNWINNKSSTIIIWIHKINKKAYIYYSIREATRQTWISHWNIIKCCKWERMSAWGYKWKYFN